MAGEVTNAREQITAHREKLTKKFVSNSSAKMADAIWGKIYDRVNSDANMNPANFAFMVELVDLTVEMLGEALPAIDYNSERGIASILPLIDGQIQRSAEIINNESIVHSLRNANNSINN